MQKYIITIPIYRDRINTELTRLLTEGTFSRIVRLKYLLGRSNAYRIIQFGETCVVLRNSEIIKKDSLEFKTFGKVS